MRLAKFFCGFETMTRGDRVNPKQTPSHYRYALNMAGEGIPPAGFCLMSPKPAGSTEVVTSRSREFRAWRQCTPISGGVRGLRKRIDDWHLRRPVSTGDIKGAMAFPPHRAGNCRSTCHRRLVLYRGHRRVRRRRWRRALKSISPRRRGLPIVQAGQPSDHAGQPVISGRTANAIVCVANFKLICHFAAARTVVISTS